MVSALGLGLLVLHGTLRTLGEFATGGYGRFLVPAAAFYAVLAAGGARCLWEARSRAAVITAAAAAPALLALTAYVHPWVLSADARQAHVLAWGVAAVAAPLVLAAALAGRDGAQGRKLLGRAGQLAAGGLAAVTLVQVAFQVHPLMLSSNPDGAHLAVNEAVEWVAASEHRDAAAITQHVMIRFLRGEKKTHRLGTNEEAIERWMDAEPGVLFFWESKYCFKRKLPTAEQEAAGVEPPPTASTLELYRKLREWGKLLWRLDFRGVVIEVYVRAAQWQGPASGGPEAPTTRPAYPLPQAAALHDRMGGTGFQPVRAQLPKLCHRDALIHCFARNRTPRPFGYRTRRNSTSSASVSRRTAVGPRRPRGRRRAPGLITRVAPTRSSRGRWVCPWQT
jgi:hypothetical protein